MPTRILVVEDEVLVARDIESRLKRMGYEVVGTAAKGVDAVNLGLGLLPDLILMDINLKDDIDGIEAAAQINKVTSIPVIYCTAYSNQETLERAKVTTPFGYVLKPFDNRELEINIEIALYKHQVERDLAETKQNLDVTLNNVSDGVLAVDGNGMIFMMNPPADRITGYEFGKGLGKTLNDVLELRAFEPGEPAVDLLDPETFAYWKQFDGLRQYLVRPDGNQVPIELSANFLEDAGEQLTVVTFRDISQQLGFEETIQRNAFYDGITELPNRALFLDRLAGSINRRKRIAQKENFAVVFIDIDGFAAIHEGFGHEIGDEIIKEVGTRISQTIRPDDTVARFSGDIFAVLFDPVAGSPGAIQATQRILDAVQEPLTVRGNVLNLTATAGIAVDEGDYSNPEDMIRDADTARSQGKRDAQGSYVVFDNAMYEAAVKFIDRKSGMQQAIIEGAFEVHYQPIISMETGTLSSMEALVRWPRPGEGMVSPAEFIPIAESTGLIIPLGELIIKTVCEQIRDWQDHGHSGFRVAVNLSPRQFETNLSQQITQALRAADIEPTALALEVTESLAMKNLERNSCTLEELQRAGLKISMDDFGTGYSSLSYLKAIPLNTLKIDKSFIANIQDDKDDRELTKAIIGIGQSLNLSTLAEGVETEEQVEILRDFGCDYIQGYFFSKPLPAADMTTYLRSLAD